MLEDLQEVLLKEVDQKKSKTKKLFQFFSIAIGILGLGAFPCFIAEESMQTAMFGAFAYQSANDMEGLAQHITVMKATQQSAEKIIYLIGWMNPLTFPAYCNYLKNNQAYIYAMERKVEKEGFKVN